MSANIYRDFNSVTTLLAIENQLTAALGIDMTYRPGTTINTKRGILADVVPEVVPRIRYFGIGIKGYANLTSENNIAQPFMPSPTDCDLYEPIPFRCVLGHPLEGEEAKQYVMMDTTTIDGHKYYRYWLKKIEFESSTVRLTKVVDRKEETFTLDSASLNPVPSDLFPTDVSKVKEHITASVTGICRVTGAEVMEVINAMYQGDTRRARISEIGTYSGIPYNVKELIDGHEVEREEAIYVQLATHKTNCGYSLSDPNAFFTERKAFENCATVII